MHTQLKSALAAGLVLAAIGTAHAQTAAPAPAPAPIVKIWNAPAYKTVAQAIIDKMWAAHGSEMVGITFHAVPPGGDKMAMIAGTWPDRIGKASAEDDIIVAKEGFILLDPRYKKNDPEPKYLVLIPLKDRNGTNIGTIVFGFRNPPTAGKSGPDYTATATFLRDQIAKEIPDAASLYGQAK